MQLHEAMVKVGVAWPFDVEHYDGRIIRYRDDAMQHVALHCAKDAGKMIGATEPIDHSRRVDEITLRRSTRNMLVNALRMAALLNADPDDLITDYLQEVGLGEEG